MNQPFLLPESFYTIMLTQGPPLRSISYASPPALSRTSQSILSCHDCQHCSLNLQASRCAMKMIKIACNRLVRTKKTHCICIGAGA